MSKDAPLAGRRILMFVGDIYEDLESGIQAAAGGGRAQVVVAGQKADPSIRASMAIRAWSDAAIAEMRASGFRRRGGSRRLHAR